MNENEAFVMSPETAAAFDSQDVTVQADPLFEGSILATVKALREGKPDPETGRRSAIVSYAIEQPITETGVEEGAVARTYNPGYRISQFLTLQPATTASDKAKVFAKTELSEFAKATRIAGNGERLSSDLLRKSLDKQVILKLSIRTDNEGNQRQSLRVKAAPVNGKA